jgi:hypothetical protein
MAAVLVIILFVELFPFTVSVKISAYPVKNVLGLLNKAGIPMVKFAV